ncbi:MAG: DUF2169 domain-containing protein [Vicinamibacterales bacterium]
MGHPAIDNATPFAVQPLFTTDEHGQALVAPIVRATYEFDLQGTLWLAEEQAPVKLEGEPATDAPISSYKYEPEAAFMKPATDVVLVGHAEPPGRGATQVDVGIKVGPVRKIARVFGDRYWVMSSGVARMSKTGELGRVPLLWEHAFGGQDPVHSTPDRPSFDPRNPVGRGFGRPLTREGEHTKLPNIEEPTQPVAEYGALVTPAGFGFTCANWEPRARLAGTYDDEWDQNRKPFLPLDFDRRFFNGAAPGLVAPGYLQGSEDIVVLNATPGGRVSFSLPGLPPPRATVVIRRELDLPVNLQLDTVVVNTDERKLFLTWRGYVHAMRGPHDVTTIRIGI